MDDKSTHRAPALYDATQRQLTTQLLQHAAATGAATVPLDLSDAELLEELVRIRGDWQLPSDSPNCRAPALDETTRQQLFLELLKHAADVGAALVPRGLSDAELLRSVARIHGVATHGA